MGEGDGDVGEDDGGVGEDLGDDDGPRQRSDATGSEGGEPPFFSFFLDLLPRCEKGFPSGPWSPWRVMSTTQPSSCRRCWASKYRGL